MAEQFGTDLDLTQDGEYNDSILISESEARYALQSMVQSSRIYFESRGLTQDEISQAVAESGEDETMLVPLSMELAAKDITSPSMPDLTTSLSNFFTMRLYATSQWEKAGLCALEALGIDIFTRIGLHAGQKIAKGILLRAIKAAAKVYSGPLGVAITVCHFVYCMQR